MTAFNIPAERATKTRSPFNWQLANAKGFRPGLACRPTSRPWEFPALNIHTERATKLRSPFNWQLASAKGFRPGLACGPTSRPWELPAGRRGMSRGPVGAAGAMRDSQAAKIIQNQWFFFGFFGVRGRVGACAACGPRAERHPRGGHAARTRLASSLPVKYQLNTS